MDGLHQLAQAGRRRPGRARDPLRLDLDLAHQARATPSWIAFFESKKR